MDKDNLRQIINVVATAAMIFVNYLANALPIGGKNTGELAGLYYNDPVRVSIIPSPYAFAIWGLIYLLLAFFVIYQALPSQKGNEISRKIGWWYSVTCLFNIMWIFFWHLLDHVYSIIPMLFLLLSLIMLYQKLETGKAGVSLVDRLAYKAPFSIYLGWITVATVVNVSVFIVTVPSLHQFFLSIASAEIWSILVLVVATLIGSATAFVKKDYLYPLVLVWALFAIATRNDFSSTISIISIICASLMLIDSIVVVILRVRNKTI